MSKLSEKEYQAQYYKNNLEKITGRKKQYREDNLERVRKQRKQSYKNNHKKALESANQYRKNHLEWIICPDCSKGRWVSLCKGKPVSIRCKSCAGKQRRGKNNFRWKGGRRKDSHGYTLIWLDATSPFIKMVNNQNYILEHRLVMAKHLGRCLTSKEKIHHKGIKYPIDSMENKQDNRIENLKLYNGHSEHLILHRKLKNTRQQN